MVQSIGFGATFNIGKYNITDGKKAKYPKEVRQGAEKAKEDLENDENDKREFSFYQAGPNYYLSYFSQNKKSNDEPESYGKSIKAADFKTAEGTKEWIMRQVEKDEQGE